MKSIGRGTVCHSPGFRERGFPGPLPDWPPEIRFLVNHGLQPKLLDRIVSEAARKGTDPVRELLSQEGFPAEWYWQRLADDLDLEYIPDHRQLSASRNSQLMPDIALKRSKAALCDHQGQPVLVVAPGRAEIYRVRMARQAGNDDLCSRIRIASPNTISAFLCSVNRPALVRHAISRLYRKEPEYSALSLPLRRISIGLALIVTILALSLIVKPQLAWLAVNFVIAFALLLGIGLKLVAITAGRPASVRAFLSDRHLPPYSVLVPLRDEANVVPDLVAALSQLDYPPSKLQILMIVDSDDVSTISALRRCVAAPHFRIVEVPDCQPRTKPKALVYGLPFATGNLICVFDAEDRPDPDQLRISAAAFAQNRGCGCIQAKLSMDNPINWISRMLTIEYAVQYDVMVPGLTRLGLPVPLGGSSNHVSTEALMRTGGWDPFNVTEDADLGFRLARFGFRTHWIDSRTGEEAPIRIRDWLAQRRRWLKGWMVTAILATNNRRIRPPTRCHHNLAMHGLMTSGLLGLLLYPLLPAYGVMMLAIPRLVFPHSGGLETLLFWINAANFAGLVLVTTGSAVIGLRRAGFLRLARWLPTMPLYWALMSFAAWQALFQTLRDPFNWEKTTHGQSARPQSTPPQKSPLP